MLEQEHHTQSRPTRTPFLGRDGPNSLEAHAWHRELMRNCRTIEVVLIRKEEEHNCWEENGLGLGYPRSRFYVTSLFRRGNLTNQVTRRGNWRLVHLENVGSPCRHSQSYPNHVVGQLEHSSTNSHLPLLRVPSSGLMPQHFQHVLPAGLQKALWTSGRCLRQDKSCRYGQSTDSICHSEQQALLRTWTV